MSSLIGTDPADGGRYGHDPLRIQAIERAREKCRKAGMPWHEGEPWTDEQDDMLLDEFLNDLGLAKNINHAAYLMILKCGRSYDGICTRLRKRSIRHPDCPVYHPRHRIDRTGQPYNRADYYIMSLATNDSGMSNLAHTPSWIAPLLGRAFTDVHMEMTRLANEKAEGFLTFLETTSRQDLKDVRIAKAVGAALTSVLVWFIKAVQQALTEENDAP